MKRSASTQLNFRNLIMAIYNHVPNEHGELSYDELIPELQNQHSPDDPVEALSRLEQRLMDEFGLTLAQAWAEVRKLMA